LNQLGFKAFGKTMVEATQTDREFSASFDRQASAVNAVSFPGLFPPKACKADSFSILFH
jgi:hypothetical protein